MMAAHATFHNKNHLIDKYNQLPQSSNLILATYIWIDSTGEVIRNKTRTIEYSPASASELPWWDTADALSTTYINTDIFLQPVRLFKDPFFKFNYSSELSGTNFLVICETYKFTKTKTSKSMIQEYM
jgi:glutamine synthetase